MNIVVIPARGGSKRIPRKNIKSFCGKPMIAHSITAALRSGVVDKVVVSTDDEEIAHVARKFGADVPFMRPADLANDTVGTRPVVRHAVEQLLDSDWPLKQVACIYATAPLLHPGLIADALEQLKRSGADYVFTAARFSFPIQRALLKTESGGVTPFDPDSIGKRSQDLPDAFHDAGQLYWANHATWLDSTKDIFSPTSQMIVLPDHRVQDIDTPEDWRRAELLYKVLRQEGEL
ncbi:pseudaminic acid cytidylyltransferase [Alteromonas aestuariivivens]|uniref:Pseudaminic acid cytidylyltransferase n=1 Tax=Alteromonas aestuariivivens TaxID=1938339 RepID=A0A3D8M7A9_9ALTE|nr:pseudaminic acid cytidylyltransferase [Alteromonas aestuariivivens]RDV25062.1 pseudaminic acid cytidylyltransferase [Alteromonas aestuariivivens]